MTPDGRSLLVQWDIMPKRVDLRLLDLSATPQLKPVVDRSGTERTASCRPTAAGSSINRPRRSEGEPGRSWCGRSLSTQARQWIVSPGFRPGADLVAGWTRDLLSHRRRNGHVGPLQSDGRPICGTASSCGESGERHQRSANGPTMACLQTGSAFSLSKRPRSVSDPSTWCSIGTSR